MTADGVDNVKRREFISLTGLGLLSGSAVSYLIPWFFGTPTVLKAAPSADTPPTTAAPSSAPRRAETTGPAIAISPSPGSKNTAGAIRSPQIAPQNAPVLP